MDGCTVRVVGSGDAFGTGGRFQACILLDAADGRVLLDCGASSLVALKQQGIDPGTWALDLHPVDARTSSSLGRE